MPVAQLTSGALELILQGEDCEKPVLQILGAKKIPGSESDRLRLLISDGKHYNSYAMLATQLNHLHEEGKLTENSVVRIDKYITSLVNKAETRRVLVILELTVLNTGSEVAHKIGNPVVYNEKAAAENAKALKPTSNNNSVETKPLQAKNTSNNNNNNNNVSCSNTSMNQSLNAGLTHPIAGLSPYQNKWVIRARVLSKSAIRTWSNAKGEGKLFSMDLMDESGEIRATAFKEQCDKFYDMIEPDRVYYISKCMLKPANKQYTTLNNDYEMTFTSETVVQPCDEDSSSIPELKYDLIQISEIANMESKAAVDTIGICKEVGDMQVFTSRTSNKEFKKRDLVLIDQSNASVNLTLWGDDAENFSGEGQPVILVKGARINEFNGGKSLSIGNGAVMKLNPDIKECHHLRGWFDNGGAEGVTVAVSARTGAGGNFNSEWLTFLEAQQRNLGNGDKPDYFQCKATIHLVKHQNAFYKACALADCNKKVVDEGNGHYRCERCNSVNPSFKYRLLLSISLADWTSNRWTTCFSDVAEQLLGRSTQEICESIENEEANAEEVFSTKNFHSYIFKLRTKVEIYGDTARNKIIIQSLSPINYKEYNKYLINNLKQLTGVQKH